MHARNIAIMSAIIIGRIWIASVSRIQKDGVGYNDMEIAYVATIRKKITEGEQFPNFHKLDVPDV